jgi:hypothetical protein
MITTKNRIGELRRTWRCFAAMKSAGAGLDFIDLRLDDDYGLADLSLLTTNDLTSEHTLNYFRSVQPTITRTR